MRGLRTRSRQTGAVAVFAAIAAGAGLTALALAIDVGRLYSAQRDLQRIANLAALDAARVTGGCFGEPENPTAAAFNETIASIERNHGRLGGRGSVRPLSVEVGRENRAADGHRYFDPAFERNNHAVRVVLSRSAPARLLPLAPAAGELAATAAARSRPYASVHVGSRLAELDPPALDRLFNALFDTDGISISAAGYTSLLEAQVPINEVIDVLDPGSDDDIDVREVSVAELLRRLVDALGNAGNDLAAATAARIEALANATEPLLPASLVAVEREAARLVGSALINAGDLTLLIAQATAESAVVELLYTLPPPLGDSTALIRIIDPGQVAQLTTRRIEGDPQENFAANAQALLMTDLGIALPQLGVSVDLPLWVRVAHASAQVVDIRCARSGAPQDVVTVDARTSISRVGIGVFDDPAAPEPQMVPANLLDAQLTVAVLGLNLPVRARIAAAGMVEIPSVREELVFTGPFPADAQPIGGPDTALLREALAALPSQLEIDVELDVLGGQLGVLDAAVDAALDLLQTQLEQTLRSRLATTLLAAVDPLLARALRDTGLRLGGADVRVDDLTAEEPYLFTR